MDKLKIIFKEDFIKEEIPPITIEETEQDGECRISLNFEDNALVINTKNNLFDYLKDIFKFELLRKTCDGIVLYNEKIILIELKKSLSFRSFKKALVQLISSYIKLRLLLGELIDFNNLEVELIIGTKNVNIEDKEIAYNIFNKHKESIEINDKLDFKLKKILKILKKENKYIFEELIFHMFIIEKRKILEIDENFIQTFRNFQKENIPIKIKFCD
jgi:hypothetical protein